MPRRSTSSLSGALEFAQTSATCRSVWDKRMCRLLIDRNVGVTHFPEKQNDTEPASLITHEILSATQEGCAHTEKVLSELTAKLSKLTAKGGLSRVPQGMDQAIAGLAIDTNRRSVERLLEPSSIAK
jgi:hypothetical protein